MVEFATQSGYNRRKEEIGAAERLKQAAAIQQQSFDNSQQDRARADALDAAERQYYAARLGSGAAPAPATTPVQNLIRAASASGASSSPQASPEFRTAGFNPDAAKPAPAQAAQPQTAAQKLVAAASPDPALVFANVHGGGKLMAGIANMRREKEDEAERNAATAFRNGDWELFEHFNKTAKLDIPASDLQRAKSDVMFRRNMGNAALGSELYKANPRQAGAFFAAYMHATQSNPQVSPQDAVLQAIKIAGAPVDKQDWTIKELSDGAMVRISSNTGDVSPITMTDSTGKVVPVKGKAGAKTGKDLLFQVKMEAYKRAYPDASDADALAFANGDKPLGQDPTIRATYFKIASDLVKDDINTADLPLAEKQKLLSEIADGMMGESSDPYQRRGTMDVPNREASAGNVAGRDQNNPAQVTSMEEFQALPSGSYYVNPADGATYRKN
ncbi:MAG: hypothetical protein Unbinned664contig1000_47 [Prokaryotic dsDNA virus sp.]|nr:MAG: hypothetical protein Unbinned664contig1000_47 [Prokaryotic dsDNA virus sp.]|tara:strand:+ start:128 stop:1459 length:1332 start_codon:yes stop_codon:yes gene_type:complete